MKFLQWFNYLIFLAFIGGMWDAATEGTRWHTKSFTPPHFFIILCGVWLLVAAVLEVSLKLEAIAEKLERENDS